MMTIYFVGSFGQPGFEDLRGGQRVTIRHVRVLRELGHPAYAVTSESRTRRLLRGRLSTDDIFLHMSDFRAAVDPEEDHVVLPGRFATRMSDVPGNKKILFVQGAHVTLGSLGLAPPEPADPWRSEQLASIFCVSQANADLIGQLEPGCPVHVLPNAVEPDLFPYREDKEPLLLTPPLSQPEKNPLDTQAAVQILRSRAAREDDGLARFECTELAGFSRREVSELLQRAGVLLFLSTHEGMPLLVLEALLTGTVVLAWDRGPMNDLLDEECLFRFGDIQGVVAAAREALCAPESWRSVRREGRRRALTFDRERQVERIEEVWSGLLAGDRALVSH